jgi:hypothetical protein
MPPAVHYLTSNDSTWTPPALISLDTETKVIQEYPEVQALRCWHVRASNRQPGAQRPGDHVQGGGLTARDLAMRVAKWADRQPETWLYAHNLNFDLTVTKLPVLLVNHGWQVTDMALDGGRPWMVLEHGTRKLVITDSYGLWPMALSELADATGIVKPPLPEDDSPETWMARCAADTLILHTALLEVLTYHDANQLGRWGLTGASTGWNSMRHLQAAKTSKKARTARMAVGLPPVDPAAQPVVIDPSPEGRANDRLAIYGGRRETFRWGRLPPGAYSELDFERAYQTVMAQCPLPRKRGRWFDSLPLDSRLIDDPCQQFGIVAEVEIDTDQPRWPCRVQVNPADLPPGHETDRAGPPSAPKTRVFYPVGRFRTVLAGPDIAEARRLGCLISVGRGQVHQLGFAARPWATWSMTAQDDPATPAVVRLALKHQGRAVAGKWAGRSWTKTIIGASTTYGWSYQDVFIHETQTRGAIIDLAGTKFLSAPATDADNAYPAVLAWIESLVRVALGKVIALFKPAAVVQCDTDGLIVDTSRLNPDSSPDALTGPGMVAGAGQLLAALETASTEGAPLRLREKTIYRTLEVVGPQHLILDGHKRWSGVPGSAVRRPDGAYEAWTWPKLAWQLTNGDTRGYTRVVQTYRLANSYAAGWLLQDGTVAAPETRCRPDGITELVPWGESHYPLIGAVRAAQQPAVLANLP